MLRHTERSNSTLSPTLDRSSTTATSYFYTLNNVKEVKKEPRKEVKSFTSYKPSYIKRKDKYNHAY